MLGGSGVAYPGCNVESASYGATICAERSAVVGAVSAGESAIRACVVVTPTAEPSSPCGICRQLLREFGAEMVVFAASSVSDSVYAARLGDLLPLSFGPDNLEEARREPGGGSGMTADSVDLGEPGPGFELGREIPPAEQPARLSAMAAEIRRRTDLVPRLGLVLGSGLGGLADAVEAECSIGFAEVPGWPPATAPGHAGRLVVGRLAGVPVVVHAGPFPPLRGPLRRIRG